jgi:uncharacterized membrane-anchored protein
MTADVTIKGGARLDAHPLRAAILSEVHARPFTAVETPCRLLHFAFHTGPQAAQADRAALAAFCDQRGLEPLKPGAKHHRLSLSGAILRWEQHSEFTTYTWELPADGQRPFQPAATAIAAPLTGLPQPGPVLVALDVHAIADHENGIAVERVFDRASVAVAENSEGDAVFATDFQLDAGGFVRILVVDRGLGPPRARALVSRPLQL